MVVEISGRKILRDSSLSRESRKRMLRGSSGTNLLAKRLLRGFSGILTNFIPVCY